MSLHWRFMGLIIVVIAFAVLVTAAVGYYTTQARLGLFVNQLSDVEAIQLAANLSREYTAAGDWQNVDGVLSATGYDFAEDPPTQRSEGSGAESLEFFHQDPVRAIIIGVDGQVVKDTSSELIPGTTAPNLGGHSEIVFDLATNQPVGRVYVDVDQEFLATESHGFLNALFYTTLIAALLTAGIAILLAAWLSKRITAPVTALTEATQAIALGDTMQLQVNSSDELGRMSAAFNRMTCALESQRALRKRLLNDVSHELNTPLSVIQLEAIALRDGLQAPEAASAIITQEVDSLRGLVTDLNWLAESDSGAINLTLEAISIHEFLTAELDRWQPQSQARHIAMSLHVPEDIPAVDLDRMRMRRALGNVLLNAINFSEVGGRILIETGLENASSMAISIADDGIGIDAADLPNIFNRFYRTDQSRSRQIGGTGLGLAIARAIVEAHGGTVTAASDGRGLGVTVTIRLPLNRC